MQIQRSSYLFVGKIFHLIRFSEFEGDVKGTPFSLVTFHPDLTILQIHQFFADGQPEARTSEYAGGICAFLGKAVENFILFVLSDPHSGIIYLKLKRDGGIGFIFLFKTNGYTALLGEFHGVAYQVV